MVSAGTARKQSIIDVQVLPELLIARWRLQRLELRRQIMQLLSCELLPEAAHDQAMALQTLCTDLIDYVSTGHFEVYGRILPRRPWPERELHDLTQHILHHIGKTTDAVLGFNDRYELALCVHPPGQVSHDLGKLSRSLLLRFALEEQLLELCGL